MSSFMGKLPGEGSGIGRAYTREHRYANRAGSPFLKIVYFAVLFRAGCLGFHAILKRLTAGGHKMRKSA